MVKSFIENAAALSIDLNIKNNKGSTAFHQACLNGHSNVIKIFMDGEYSISASALRIDHNRKDKYGCTAFHYVCQEGNSELVKIFMENAAALSINLHLKNNDGMTGLDLANRFGCTDVVKIFCLMEKASALSSIDLD